MAGQRAGPIVTFLDVWEDLSTKDVGFDHTLNAISAPGSSDSISLECLREMDSLRRSTCGKASSMKDRGEMSIAHLQRLESYLGLLSKLNAKGDPIPGHPFLWSSPMAGKPTLFLKCLGLKQEEIMATFHYGGALRSLAHQLVSSSLDSLPPAGPQIQSSGSSGNSAPSTAAVTSPLAGSPTLSPSGSQNATSAATTLLSPSGSFRDGGGSEPTVTAGLAEASTLLRKAAGVFQWLAQTGCPRIVLEVAPDRPAELLSGMSLCLQSACQAEAQAITAHRAGQRCTTPATTAALHEGAAELFDEASRALKANTGQFNTVSDRLRRYLALSSALQHVCAYKSLSDDLRLKGQAGQGEACCVEASRICESCVSIAQSDPLWKAHLLQHAGAVEAFRSACEKDRINITYQTVSRTVPVMVGPKVLATPILYQPTPTESMALG